MLETLQTLPHFPLQGMRLLLHGKEAQLSVSLQSSAMSHRLDLWAGVGAVLQVMKTYHMYNADSISAQSKLKEAEKQEEKQIGKSVKQEDRQTPRSPDSSSNVRIEEKHVRRSSVKKIEKMKEKVRASALVTAGEEHSGSRD